MSRSKAGMGGSKPKSKSSSKKPHEIHVKRAHGGGFIAKHHHKSKPGEDQQEPEEHVVPDMDALQQHLQDNLGDQPAAGMPPQGAPAPAPQAQAAAPAPAAPQGGM